MFKHEIQLLQEVEGERKIGGHIFGYSEEEGERRRENVIAETNLENSLNS